MNGNLPLRSIINDRGLEFADHKRLRKKLGGEDLLLQRLLLMAEGHERKQNWGSSPVSTERYRHLQAPLENPPQVPERNESRAHEMP
jgi:hypothetical protein